MAEGIHSFNVKRLNKKMIFHSNQSKRTLIYFPLFVLHINFHIVKTSFRNSLKYADITLVHEKDDSNYENNYRPVSILPSFSKAFEISLYGQIYGYTDHILSKAQCSFRKDYITQYSMFSVIEKWRGNLDEGGIYGALFTDLRSVWFYLLVAKTNW